MNIPQRITCTNKNCFAFRADINSNTAKYCPECGNILELVNDNLYIKINRGSIRGEKDKTIEMPIREFIKLLREYEKEEFIEKI